MMCKSLCLCLGMLGLSAFHLEGQTPWKPAGDKILTPWAASVDPARPLPEYPRPQMQRSNWTNLNGMWDYAIQPVGEAQPAAFEGKILVPFAVESALSGVGKTVGKDHYLWYKRVFDLPKDLNNNRLLLHFGAADWQCNVRINGRDAGSHQGGYTPFSMDITPYLQKGTQELLVRVWDPTDDGPQPRGKQVKNPEGIWYTAVSGIWQTVWLEVVPVTHIGSVLPKSDIDRNILTVAANVIRAEKDDVVKITVLDAGKIIAEQSIAAGSDALFALTNPKYWSPEQPFLYDLNIQVLRKGKVLDEVSSYAAMRKISLAPDANGVQKLMLNNRFLFQYGLLDQGWWPDGLYTAATDEALRFDVEQCKKMGFNLLRKHVKVEPARWYYHCDRLGMLVWQDMPSGDLTHNNVWVTNAALEPVDKTRTPESEKIYRDELKELVEACRFFPSIVTWVPFNEAWGQFKTDEITRWLMDYDPDRLVNCASGGNFFLSGHIHDYHNYPPPVMHRADIFGQKRAMVLGEFGGLGLPLEGHTWQAKANWGYQSFENADALLAEYARFVGLIEGFIPRGLSGAIYTQVSDVEIEVNGLMTYDRKVVKMPAEKLKALNERLWRR